MALVLSTAYTSIMYHLSMWQRLCLLSVKEKGHWYTTERKDYQFDSNLWLGPLIGNVATLGKMQIFGNTL